MTFLFSRGRVGMRIASGIRNSRGSRDFFACVYATSLSQSAPPAQVRKQSSESGRLYDSRKRRSLPAVTIVRDAGFSNSTLPVPAAALILRN